MKRITCPVCGRRQTQILVQYNLKTDERKYINRCTYNDCGYKWTNQKLTEQLKLEDYSKQLLSEIHEKKLTKKSYKMFRKNFK